jgi:GNAT superfamily N-acetyltransferase
MIDIRPIDPDDAEALARFHSALSPESTRLRYFSPHPTLSPSELLHLTSVDHHEREALVVLDGSEIAGVARFERLGRGTDAEVAFVVADRLQDHGIGSTLLARLAERARAEGITRLVADTLFENRSMIDVFEHSGLPVERSMDDGVVHYRMAL